MTRGDFRGAGHRPTAQPPRSGRVHPVTRPAVELAVTTHVGEHDDIDVTYGELGAWVVGNALAVAGPVRETCLVGPRDTADPSAWRTQTAGPSSVRRRAEPTGTATEVFMQNWGGRQDRRRAHS